MDLLLASNILAFNGPYTLKSGRRSPYFFNAGLFNSGSKIAELARCYGEAIVGNGLLGSSKEDVEDTVLFGPAYKVSRSYKRPPASNGPARSTMTTKTNPDS